VRRGDGQPARRLAGRHRGAGEGQEDLLRHVLGLVARPQDPRRDADDAGVRVAEDLLEVVPDRAGSSPHLHGLLASRSGGRPRLPYGMHIRRAPRAARM
jgi:hypothetical protein